MDILFNVLVVAFAGLIAYWWANQGAFSALLHLLCVIAAGAVAFALWEPLTVRFLLTGGWFDDYAWGVSLLGLFAVSLFVFRLACDKIAPENLNLPSWVNYVVGGLFGAVAGVLTVGICLIGMGFMQSSVELMGFRGHARDSQFAGQPGATDTIYPPMHTIAAEFYGFLSDGALAPTFSRVSLRRAYPELDDVAASLHRDSFADGKGKTSMPPDAAQVGELFKVDAPLGRSLPSGAYGVPVKFDRQAFDRGEMLVVSASQVRLIGPGPGGDVVAVHPVAWSQAKRDGSLGDFAFDDITHYATSVAGQQATTIFFMFPSAPFGGLKPEFIQIKGVRYRLPEAVKTVAINDWLTAKATSVMGQAAVVSVDPEAPFIDERDIRVDNGIAPLNLSVNQVTGMDVVDNFIASGRAEFPRDAPFNPGRQLRVKGLLEAPNTKMVKVNVSRGTSSVDLFNDRTDARRRAGEQAQPVLVDENGRTYAAVGYLWIKPDKVEIKMDPSRGIRTVSEVPNLPSAGTHELWLLFSVTEGANIVGVRLGDVTVANVLPPVSTGPAQRGPKTGSLEVG